MTTPPEESQYDRWSLKDKEALDYGYFASKAPTERNGGYYITTAINYTNGPPHMGHAYEAITADALARFARLRGEEAAYFVTGTDEHGQKVANMAAEKGMTPNDICNLYATGFQNLNQRVLVSNDDYIRTTSERHKKTARELWKRCSHDIYLDTYNGWYNVREEAFVTDKEAELSDYKDAVSGKPLKQVEEESYFFKMSAYQERLIQHIEENPDFIRPEQHRNLILQRLRSDDLRDLSISRTTFKWGIGVPEGFHDHHVMYVWVDALSNYLTGVDALGVNGAAPVNIEKFWPANVHIIGKDILWFHTVIWPCLLMSAGVQLPLTVFAHGFVNDKEGKKMSKSMGNVVDPHDMLDKYPVDIFRWYLCKEAPYGGELAFSENSLRDMHNADLCDTLGNLVHRATNLCKKYCDGVIPDVPTASPIDFSTVLDTYLSKMSNFELEHGASIAIQGFRDLNGYLTEEAPWLKKGAEFAELRRSVVRTALEAIYVLTHLLTPFIPEGSAKIFRKLNTEPKTLATLSRDGTNLEVGTAIQIGDVLYTKILSEEETLDANEAARKKAISFAESQRRKKETKAKLAVASKAGQTANLSDQPEFTKMDIRVGEIVKVWLHPEADKLFCEEIDIGEEGGPRQIASGLREHYDLDQMQGRKVLVVCNLKAAKIVGFTSNGMVLAATADDGSKVELIDPPAGAAVGERVFIEGLSGDPFSPNLVKKRKTWDFVEKGLKTGEGGVATWDGKVIQASTGACSAASLVGARIS